MESPKSNRSDLVVLRELGASLERARLASDRTQQQVADAAGVSKRTLERIEAGESTTTVNLVRVLRALGLLGRLDALAPPPRESPLALLERSRKERQRASRARRPRGDAVRDPVASDRPGAAEPPFRWGDEDESSP